MPQSTCEGSKAREIQKYDVNSEAEGKEVESEGLQKKKTSQTFNPFPVHFSPTLLVLCIVLNNFINNRK